MIVFDTSALSLAFRRARGASSSHQAGAAIERILESPRRAFVPGVVLQEILSGCRVPDQFQQLRGALAAFPILLANRSDHENAAEIRTRSRERGITAAAIDCLIAAQTVAIDAELFTFDSDFERIGQVCPLRLHRHGIVV